jgi:hypothetical protein
MLVEICMEVIHDLVYEFCMSHFYVTPILNVATESTRINYEHELVTGVGAWSKPLTPT